jgi:hypothetical protein
MIIVLSIFIPISIFVLSSFMLFDELVRLEYSSHRKHWEADGQPHGFFWWPFECRTRWGTIKSRSSAASLHCSFWWPLSTPGWMRSDERALRLVFWLRALMLTWNLAIVGAFVAFVVLVLMHSIGTTAATQ